MQINERANSSKGIFRRHTVQSPCSDFILSLLMISARFSIFLVKKYFKLKIKSRYIFFNISIFSSWQILTFQEILTESKTANFFSCYLSLIIDFFVLPKGSPIYSFHYEIYLFFTVNSACNHVIFNDECYCLKLIK